MIGASPLRLDPTPGENMSTPSYDWIAHHAATRPDQVAQLDLASGRSFTYAEMNDRTGRLARALATDFGVGPGDRVAVLAHNDTNFFEVQFACWKLGAIFVPLNWRLAGPELEYILGDCTPTVIATDGDFVTEATRLARQCGIPHVMSWGPGSADVAGYEDVIADAAHLEGVTTNTHDTIVTIMYTSGTTGRPKGAEITQGMVFWNAANCVEFFGLGSTMTNLAFLPLFHTGGLNVFANPAFHFGGRNLVMKTFDPAATLDALTDPELGVTHFIGVPANYLFMSQVPRFDSATFPTIESAAVGGAPTPVALIETWAAKGLALQQAFGMTETSPLVTALKPEDCAVKLGSAGLPAMHCEVRIVDEDGRDVAAGEMGELWVRGPNITPGYWNRPEATAEAFVDGFLRTGDAARVDEDGFVYIVDRWKDMYISGGENVYPAEVEAVIFQLPEVGEVAVIGVPDEKWGEVGRAVVVPREGCSIEAAAVINHCRSNLARFKVPHSVVFVDEIPHNATGKVLKRELREA